MPYNLLIMLIISHLIVSAWVLLLIFLSVVAIIIVLYLQIAHSIEKKREILEKEIEIRTTELKNLNLNLMDEIKMRKDAEMRLLQQTEELKESITSKDKFFSIISHDLKSPFQGLLGYTELLKEDFDSIENEDKKRIVEEIRCAALHMYNLLQNILEWSRLQTNRIDFKPNKINLFQIAQEVINTLHSNASSKKITIQNELNTELHAYADSNMLHSILQNLLSNSIKFTNENGLVRIRAVESVNNIVVSVIDNGIGISPENINKLFKVGIQHSTKGTNEEQGTGLGLLICKEMVLKNGGSIWVESTLGKGSSFRFTLPLYKSNSERDSIDPDLFSS